MLATTKNQLQDTNNDIVYDAAGNVTQPGPTGGPYVYDAENHLTSAGGVTYTYDGDGNRVMKSNGTIYWYGANSASLEETDLSGNALRWYYFFNGQRVARQLPTNEVGFYMTDHLGNVRYLGGAATGYSIDYYPFGGIIVNSDIGDDRYQFTGKERDAESGLDNFGARFDASSFGRFMTPDPLGGSLFDPQTLNKYAYVRNSPTTLTDPTGLYTCRDSKDCSSKADKKFEKTLGDLRNSSDPAVARAAAAYGGVNKDNGVTVGFADLSTKGENGEAVSTIGYADGNLRANTAVTINSKIDGDSYAAAIGHEGSHTADAQDVVKSGLTEDGQVVHAGMDITHYQSETTAWGVTQSILKSGNFTQSFDCGPENCKLGANVAIGDKAKLPAQLGEVIDQILATQKIYNQGGSPMGPNNQGPNIVNGVTLTPKATLPH